MRWTSPADTANIRMTLLPVNLGAFGMSDVLSPGSRIPAGDLSRLTVSTDGRLYWDDKPVVILRRIQLTFWQKLGMMLIGFAALMIAISAAVHASITVHDWMCSAKWLTRSCPVAASSIMPVTIAPPQVQPQSAPSAPS